MELLDSELANILSGHSNPSHGFMLKNMVPGIPVRQSFKIFKIFKQIIRFNLTKKKCKLFDDMLYIQSRVNGF